MSNPVFDGQVEIPPKPPSAHVDDETAKNIPLALRLRNSWVTWGWRWGGNKYSKPPISHLTGRKIDQTDPANWMSFDQAREASATCDGIGFALGNKTQSAEHDEVYLDIDHCIDDKGTLSPEASKLREKFPSYTEITPSGRGIRIITAGRKPGDKCRKPTHPDKFLASIEIYTRDRYITVTGRKLEGSPSEIVNCQEALDDLYKAMFEVAEKPKKEKKTSKSSKKHQGNGQPVDPEPMDDSDEALLDRARRAKNGEKFAALFDRGEGDSDDSVADEQLMAMLAFWTKKDPEQMERLFSASALGQRDKWTDREDYRQRTIAFAIDKCVEVYEGREAEERRPSFYEKDGHLYFGKTWLANFTARITRTIIRHEGLQDRTQFDIVAENYWGFKQTIVVDAEKYSSMAWVSSLGAEFIIEPGRDVKDLVRAGIQKLSIALAIPKIHMHTSLGWLKDNGLWFYLHAGGALGAWGQSSAMTVDVSNAINHYRLPGAPADPAMLQNAMNAHLHIWHLAPRGHRGGQAAAAVIATLPWRAVLSAFDASIHLGGPTGNMKTSLARLAYQHFSDIQGRNTAMPADWSATTNGLQRMLFDCRDSLLIVDDLKEEKHVRTAETVMQSQGNLQGRLRMNFDQAMQKALPPRGSLLSTGEVDPRTQSTLGRVLLVELQKGDINLDMLTRLQAAGDEGLFASLMSAYIQWLAGRLDDVRTEHTRLTVTLRSAMPDLQGVHPRHPDMVAQLVAAYSIFLRFAVEHGLTTQALADDYARRVCDSLLTIGIDQAEIQEECKPGRRFLDLLASAMLSGRCHLTDADAPRAPNGLETACGWRQEIAGKSGWNTPGGSKCIGYISMTEAMVYLDPSEAGTIATEMARSCGLPQSFANVGRELRQEGLLQLGAETDGSRQTQRKRLHGVRKRYFFVATTHLFGIDPGTAGTVLS